MANTSEYDYALERRLRELDPALHRRFTDAVFSLQHILSNYKLVFPSYTDHTELHSLTVIDFCNRLIGDQIDLLNVNEIYILLLSCYFHDTGMGISKKDYETFSREIDFGNYFETHSRDDVPRIIRDFHNEFSGLFIRKYAAFFEIPSEEHLWAIIEISRGHRKTPLLDEKQYPVDFPVPGGDLICLPYLASLVRLADEIDASAARNPVLLYSEDSIEIHEYMRHKAIKEVAVLPEEFVLRVKTGDEAVYNSVVLASEKMQTVLDECRSAVQGRTRFAITQKRVSIQML